MEKEFLYYTSLNFVFFTFTKISTFFNSKNIEKKKMNKPPLWKKITKNNYIEHLYL